jgi:hypothetical protein
MRTLLALALSVALLGGAAAAAPHPATAAPPFTYGDYSMMLTPGTTSPGGTAGQLWYSGAASAQWTWTPQPDGVSSNILWSSPATWPAGNIEHLTVNGPWVELSGWSGTTNGSTGDGRDYTQTVNTQFMGTGDCSQMLPVPVHNGHEIYALWAVPTYSYCIDVVGVITSPENPAANIHFEHWEKWSVVPSCSNLYFTGDSCIQQDEKWWDDNQHTYSLQTDRSGLLAKGKGWYASTNRVIGGVPNTASISGRYYWLW